ncbi:SPOR domain-containing protein [Herbaspirillum sp. RTI4]|uniref:SPOR domain-containing protein n=1 Tax=Herbaspirillum sp. RTI4 TaxID=3048640 RepID=UPI002AB5532F|nr:SPOR domain-containing protein [Herbaspirillum sp. RTI4]MDY7576975.1 SPOR domain-containing protein [Herbaspirillum sp. RTI4]MEA9982123.1 SPOR domain-containing protein [Herbaspirillum sp. RTI4]
MNTSQRRTKQAGGTLLGLIIGLVVGLGIAVVVALMITKSPLPFTNRPAKDKSTELAPDQVADPNRPLYGNRASREAESAATSAGVVAPLPPQEVKKADTTIPKPDPKPMTGEKAVPDVKPAAPVVKGDAEDEKWLYFLQAGAFRDQADAESARARLALLGFEAKITEKKSDTGLLYRVRMGPYAQQEIANRYRGKLSDNGVDAAVVRLAK